MSGATAAAAVACPFCDVVGRPLAARRDAAAVVAVGVAVGEAAGAAAGEQGLVRQPFPGQALARRTRKRLGELVARTRVLQAPDRRPRREVDTSVAHDFTIQTGYFDPSSLL